VCEFNADTAIAALRPYKGQIYHASLQDPEAQDPEAQDPEAENPEAEKILRDILSKGA
jgi:hypothetical protein